MIGQRHLREMVAGQIRRNKFPKFSIIIGESGSGKKTIVNEMAKLANAEVAIIGKDVESIRNMIDTSWNVTSDKIFYVIPQADLLSQSAGNALLKIAEEPPKNTYIILLVENEDNLTNTIRSRGVCYRLDPYTYDELSEFYDDFVSGEHDKEFIINTATTPGNVLLLASNAYEGFEGFVNLVVDNISKVSGSNALKIVDKIAVKDDVVGYDIGLFLKAFTSICADRVTTERSSGLKLCKAIAITGDTLSELRIRGINKQMLFDMWVLKIRGVWDDD